MALRSKFGNRGSDGDEVCREPPMIAVDVAAAITIDGGMTELETPMIKTLSTVMLASTLLMSSVAVTYASAWPKALWDRIQANGGR